jgi:hypothetical protein
VKERAASPVRRDPPAQEPEIESAHLPLVADDAEIDPILLALLHAAMFLDLSEEPAVESGAARSVLERIGLYVQRLSDDEVEELAVSLERLAARGERDGWPPAAVHFVSSFLENCGFAAEPD